MHTQPTPHAGEEVQGLDLSALCAQLAADRARMQQALLMLRNHSSVSAHQIDLIDEAMSGGAQAPAGWISPTAISWANRQSETVVKLTRAPQPEYGFTAAVFVDSLPADDRGSRLRAALEKEMRRRRVLSLPRKLELMRELGLQTLDEADNWMPQTAADFETAAKDFLA